MIVSRIAQESGVSALYIEGLILTASRRYKSYNIPKRTGGIRKIDHPAREIKFLQHWLLRHLLMNLPVHSSATAYREGSSILNNANAHSRQNYLLKLDFTNFFPSIKSEDVVSVINEHRNVPGLVDLSDHDIGLVSKIVCKDGALTIGAPTSPLLSNAVMFGFDAAIASYCANVGAVYTRYADDIAVSTNVPDVLSGVLGFIRGLVSERSCPSLILNEDKTLFTSRKRRKVVTGLFLTPDGKVSIGREKKRKVKYMIHRWTQKALSEGDISYLRGYLAFCRAVEPRFVTSLERKYGVETVLEIERSDLIARKGLGPI